MIRFFIDGKYKLWSDHGHVEKFEGREDTLKFINSTAAELGLEWEFYTPYLHHDELGERFVDAYKLTLTSISEYKKGGDLSDD